jgi:hypothetical protein
LLDAAPVPNPRLQRERRADRRSHNATLVPPSGADACLFASRCVHATDTCRERRPQLERTPMGTLVACHHWERLG